MSAKEVGNLVFIVGIMIMNQHIHLMILRNNLNSRVQKLGLEGRYLFRQDKYPKLLLSLYASG